MLEPISKNDNISVSAVDEIGGIDYGTIILPL